MVSIFKIQYCFSPFGPVRGKRGEEGGKASNIWSAHGDVVILTSLAGHTEGIKPRRRRGREGEPERKGWEWEVEEEEQGEGEWSGRKGSPKKESEGAEATCGCGRNGLAMEGDKFSGKAQLSAQMKGTFQASLFIFLWDSVSVLRELASVPPTPSPVVFSTLSFCPVCWLHVFVGFWTWSWELCRVCVAA